MFTSIAFSSHAAGLSLKDFYSMLRKHPALTKAQWEVLSLQDERESLKGDKDWNLFADARLSHDTANKVFLYYDEKNESQASIGIEKKFWKTGGELSANFFSSRTDYSGNEDFFLKDAYSNGLIVRYTHPLIRNKKGMLSRLAFDLKKYDIDMTRVLAEEQQENFIKQCTLKYLEWAYTDACKSILSERLHLSQELLSDIQKKRSSNLVDEVDVLRAEGQLIKTKEYLLQTETQWKALLSYILNIANEKKAVDYSPEFDFYKTRYIEEPEKAKEYLCSHSRLIKPLDTHLIQLEAMKKAYQNEMRTDLSLMAESGVNQTEASFSDSIDFNEIHALLGLKMNFAIPNTRLKHLLSGIEKKIMVFEEEKNKVILELSAAASEIIIRLKYMDNILELNRESIRSTMRRTEEELKNYNQGRGDFTFVIQSRDSELDAKLSYAGNTFLWHQLYAEYEAIQDRLLDRIHDETKNT